MNSYFWQMGRQRRRSQRGRWKERSRAGWRCFIFRRFCTLSSFILLDFKSILASVVPTIRILFTFIPWINLFWKQSDESPSPRHLLQRPQQRNARPSENMEEWWSRLLVKICEIVSRQLLPPIKKSWTICNDDIPIDFFVIYDSNASKWKDKDM